MSRLHLPGRSSTWRCMISSARARTNSPCATARLWRSWRKRKTVALTASSLVYSSSVLCSSDYILLIFKSGWWYCQKKDGSTKGFTPGNYLTRVTPEPSYSQVASAAHGLLLLTRGIVMFSLLTVPKQLRQTRRGLTRKKISAREALQNLMSGPTGTIFADTLHLSRDLEEAI